MRYIKLVTFLFMAFTISTNAQDVRRYAMGGLSFSIQDSDYQLNLFDIAGNPAWLDNDKNKDYLEVTPNYSGTSGSLKRQFDPARNYIYGVSFEGVRKLKANGTFFGKTSYNFDSRKNVYRTLEYNTYSGDPFFIRDTTSGNFLFHGPQLEFIYSFNLSDKIAVGVSAGYGITQGLKDTYARAEILHRLVSGGLGISYRFSENSAAGLNLGITDAQEKIDVDSDDLLDVEIFRFRGETFSIRKSSGSVTQKNHYRKLFYGGQYMFKPAKNFQAIIAGKITSAYSQLLIPYTNSKTNESFREYEDGYTNYNTSEASFIIQYKFSQYWLFGLTTEYQQKESWSKNPTLGLLLWEWNTQNITAGTGFSYSDEKITTGFEYKIGIYNADSSKHVDSKFTDLNSVNNTIILGCELKLNSPLSLRAGYVYSDYSNDLLFPYLPTSNNQHNITTGLAYQIPDILKLEMAVSYNHVSNSGNNSLYREAVSALLTLTLYEFNTF